MRINLILVLGLLCVVTEALAQRPVISGYVRDDRGEALSGASVSTRDGYLARTNAYGFFSLAIAPVDSVRLEVSGAGHQTLQLDLLLPDAVGTPLSLTLLPVELATVEILAKSEGSSFSAVSPLGNRQFSMQQLARIPAPGGESDLLKALAMTPGVSQGVEGTSGILVRGGTPDQNLILLDGSTVYNVSHAFGFLSVFNADAVQSVDLMTGPFPARFGGRLSSIIDVHMREGSRSDWHGKIGLGLVSSKFLLEGPVVKEKSSFIASGRTSNLSLLLLPSRINYTRNEFGEANHTFFQFWDFNIKYNHTINKKNNIFVSLYGGGDVYELRQRAAREEPESVVSLQWGNLIGCIRHTWLASDRLFIKNNIHISDFNYSLRNEQRSINPAESQRIRGNTSVRDVSVRSELEYAAGQRHLIKAGVEVIIHGFMPQNVEFRIGDSLPTLRSPSGRVTAREWSVYAEDEFSIRTNLVAGYGLRYNAFLVNGRQYASLQPRIGLRYNWTPVWALKIGYSEMQQNLHLLTNNGIGLPNDIWLPATERVAPQSARQITGGVVREFRQYGMNASFEAYYKHMKNQIDAKDNANFLFNIDQNWQDLIETGGVGRAYGFEWFIQKSRGRFTAMAGYTLAWSARRFANIDQGAWYFSRYDRRHDVELSGSFKLNKQWEISANWVYQTGAAITLPTGRYEGPLTDPPGFAFTYTARNGVRLPAYHRADISFTRTKPVRKWKGERILSLQIYNVYNRQNPYYLELANEKIVNASGEVSVNTKLVQRSLLPILPSFNWSITF